MRLVTFRYRHTTCVVAEAADGRVLAIDGGWPATLYEYARHLKAAGVALERVTWAMATHFHPDHAGLIGDFQARGVECVVFGEQRDHVATMDIIIQRSWKDYRPIAIDRLVHVPTAESRAWLRARGFAGLLAPTPGHSDDSVSVISDAGDAVTGDLPLPSLVTPHDTVTRASWTRVWRLGGRWIVPAHPAPFVLDEATVDAFGP